MNELLRILINYLIGGVLGIIIIFTVQTINRLYIKIQNKRLTTFKSNKRRNK